MKFRIVTPCFNAERFIQETLDSVLGQKGDFSIDYVVMDGGSTDNTIEILTRTKDRIEREPDPRIRFRFFSEKDEGMYHAVYKGFKLTTGDVCAYINADDLYMPNAFSAVADVFLKYPQVKWLTGTPTRLNEKGQNCVSPIPFKYSRSLLTKGFYGTTVEFLQQESTFWRSDLMACIDMEAFSKCKYAGDFFLWRHFAEHENLYIMASVLAGFRIHGNNFSNCARKEYMSEFNSIRKQPTIIDRQVFLLFLLCYYLPNRFKKLFNRRLIILEYGKWVIK